MEGKGQFTFPDCKLSLRIPSASTSTPHIALRLFENGTVVGEAVLPAEVLVDDKPSEAESNEGEGEKEAATGSFECPLATSSQSLGRVTFRRAFRELVDEDTANDVNLTDEESKNLLGCVRFPNLSHDALVEASKDGVMLECGAQQLILNALSSRLSAYEPGGQPDGRRPRLSTGDARQLSPQKPGRDVVESPRKTEPVTTQELTFDHSQNFDENGLLYFLATKGREIAWRNPHGAGQVKVISSGVGFGTMQDLVGRQVVNLRSPNEENSW